jgi:hypothetical protein
VASRVGDIPEFLEHELTGPLVEPGDAGSLAAAIRRLLANPADATALGRQARASLVSRGITLRHSLMALSEIYRGLAGGARRPITAGLRRRARLAMAVYRQLRLFDERARWLAHQATRRSNSPGSS